MHFTLYLVTQCISVGTWDCILLWPLNWAAGSLCKCGDKRPLFVQEKFPVWVVSMKQDTHIRRTTKYDCNFIGLSVFCSVLLSSCQFHFLLLLPYTLRGNATGGIFLKSHRNACWKSCVLPWISWFKCAVSSNTVLCSYLSPHVSYFIQQNKLIVSQFLELKFVFNITGIFQIYQRGLVQYATAVTTLHPGVLISP